MNELELFGWEIQKEIIKDTYCLYLSSIQEGNSIIKHYEEGKLAGFLVYKKEDSNVLILETCFQANDKFALLRSFKEAIQGCRNVYANCAALNFRLRESLEKMKFKITDSTPSSISYHLERRYICHS